MTDLDVPQFALGTAERVPTGSRKYKSGCQKRKVGKAIQLKSLGKLNDKKLKKEGKAEQRNLLVPALENAKRHLRERLEPNFMNGFPQTILLELESFFRMDFEEHLQRRHKNVADTLKIEEDAYIRSVHESLSFLVDLLKVSKPAR
jgi:hypothetical protein